jgi:hypothetical protein
MKPADKMITIVKLLPNIFLLGTSFVIKGKLKIRKKGRKPSKKFSHSSSPFDYHQERSFDSQLKNKRRQGIDGRRPSFLSEDKI